MTLSVVPTMHMTTPKITMNHASTFFLTTPFSSLAALTLTPLSLAYTKYIQPGMANMISEPNREPFRPMTTSTFVIRIATVTVESRTPAAVL